MKALLIEDENRAAKHLKNLIGEVAADIEVIAVLQTIEQSIKWFCENAMPDLVFLDIHLADGSAFEIFKEVTIEAPIIFTTAYDEYALKAFGVNSIDYLLKPINKEDLSRALTKMRKLLQAKGPEQYNSTVLQNLIETIGRESSYKKSLLVSYKDKLIPVATNDIAYFRTEFKIVKVYTLSNVSYVIDDTLESLSQQLSPNDFFRINRQYIVSRKVVKDIVIWFSGRLLLNLHVTTKEQIFVSRSNSNDFKHWLSG
ncbi:MAG: LytTR family DNA-binding domain-containing protein [Bacteroidales bacterium]|jgi:two-component system LytT family response regulator|nr:LytTR family DNA-binding domain-containing protein [Bacteroidales bacterium]MDY0368750.1 LytTR family DNA-binding domain-containing protein [Bacteroidales bacterium]